jgi:hypothetical protein
MLVSLRVAILGVFLVAVSGIGFVLGGMSSGGSLCLFLRRMSFGGFLLFFGMLFGANQRGGGKQTKNTGKQNTDGFHGVWFEGIDLNRGKIRHDTPAP